jgi:hypothetical protein
MAGEGQEGECKGEGKGHEKRGSDWGGTE